MNRDLEALDELIAVNLTDTSVLTDDEYSARMAELLHEVHGTMREKSITFANACKRLTKAAIKDKEAEARAEAKRLERERVAKANAETKKAAAIAALKAKIAELENGAD